VLIGIVGLNGSGKDFVAKIFVKKYAFKHKDLGQEIRNELKKLGRDYLDREEMISLANERRKMFGNDYWIKNILKNYSSNDKLILTSIRNPAEAKLLKSYGGILIEIFASQKTRFERSSARAKLGGHNHGEINFDDFIKLEKKELFSKDSSKQQLLECISLASKKIDNNGSVFDLEKRVSLLMEKINF
jgi:dephospho-CoA kinase